MVIAHVAEAHPLGWWAPVVVLLGAVAVPLSGAGVAGPRVDAWLARRADAPAGRWWRLVSAAVAVAGCALAVALGVGEGLAGAVTWGVWGAAVPLAAVLGPWVGWLVAPWPRARPAGSSGASGPSGSADRGAPALPRAGWAAVASLAALAWLPTALVSGRHGELLAIGLLVYAAVHLTGAIWRGRRWWVRAEGLRATTELLGAARLLNGGRAGALGGRMRQLAAPEAALLAVAVAAPAPGILGHLGGHGSAWPGLLGPRPVQAAALLAIGLAAALVVGRLAVSGLAGGDRAAVWTVLAAGWVVVGGVERLAPAWSEGTAEPVALVAALAQLAVAALAHLAAAVHVHHRVTVPRHRLTAATGLAASALVCAVVVVGL